MKLGAAPMLYRSVTLVAIQADFFVVDEHECIDLVSELAWELLEQVFLLLYFWDWNDQLQALFLVPESKTVSSAKGVSKLEIASLERHGVSNA